MKRILLEDSQQIVFKMEKNLISVFKVDSSLVPKPVAPKAEIKEKTLNNV